MKIIGKTNNGFIVEVSADEIANLLGEKYCTQEAAQKIKVGANLSVYSFFHKKDELEKIQKTIIEYREFILKSVKFLNEFEVTKRID